jgi:hypothetical protein
MAHDPFSCVFHTSLHVHSNITQTSAEASWFSNSMTQTCLDYFLQLLRVSLTYYSALGSVSIHTRFIFLLISWGTKFSHFPLYLGELLVTNHELITQVWWLWEDPGLPKEGDLLPLSLQSLLFLLPSILTLQPSFSGVTKKVSPCLTITVHI